MDVGDRVRELRVHKDMTMTRLAESSGVSVSMMSKIESGATVPSMKRLVAIAAALEVELRQLVSDRADQWHILDTPISAAPQPMDPVRMKDRDAHRCFELRSLREVAQHFHWLCAVIEDDVIGDSPAVIGVGELLERTFTSDDDSRNYVIDGLRRLLRRGQVRILVGPRTAAACVSAPWLNLARLFETSTGLEVRRDSSRGLSDVLASSGHVAIFSDRGDGAAAVVSVDGVVAEFFADDLQARSERCDLVMHGGPFRNDTIDELFVSSAAQLRAFEGRLGARCMVQSGMSDLYVPEGLYESWVDRNCGGQRDEAARAAILEHAQRRQVFFERLHSSSVVHVMSLADVDIAGRATHELGGVVGELDRDDHARVVAELKRIIAKYSEFEAVFAKTEHLLGSGVFEIILDDNDEPAAVVIERQVLADADAGASGWMRVFLDHAGIAKRYHDVFAVHREGRDRDEASKPHESLLETRRIEHLSESGISGLFSEGDG